MEQVYNCDICKQDFTIRPKQVRCQEDGYKLTGKPVTVTAISCPACGKVYIVSVLTDDMARRGKKLSESLQRLREQERKLRADYITMFHKTQEGALADGSKKDAGELPEQPGGDSGAYGKTE